MTVGEVLGATFVFRPAPSDDAPSPCAICAAVPDPTEAPTVEGVLREVEAASKAGPLATVYLRAHSLDGEDRGVRTVEPFVREIKKRFDLLVILDALPPESDEWVDRAYAAGVDSLSYHLEVWDPERFEEIGGPAASEIGRARFLSALSHAAGVFPSGAVTSHLVLGLEPTDSTLAGVDALVETGVVPVLARPSGATTEDASEAPVFTRAREALRRKRLSTRWVRTLAASPGTLEADLYEEDGALARLRRTTIGRVAEARLSDLRRLLRVKEVRDSLDSSGL